MLLKDFRRSAVGSAMVDVQDRAKVFGYNVPRNYDEMKALDARRRALLNGQNVSAPEVERRASARAQQPLLWMRLPLY